jgi:hypothetical protein
MPRKRAQTLPDSFDKFGPFTRPRALTAPSQYGRFPVDDEGKEPRITDCQVTRPTRLEVTSSPSVNGMEEARDNAQKLFLLEYSHVYPVTSDFVLRYIGGIPAPPQLRETLTLRIHRL